jgi:protein-S-isoprenylcysteine O-methyltransferase Ste14
MADAAYGLWPREEHDVAVRFGVEWDEYAARTPAFLPRVRSLTEIRS